MNIANCYNLVNGPLFSVEVIPPRNGQTLEDTILATIEPLLEFDLAYISVTHHAKNSLKSGTGPIARILQERYGIPVLAHLTCTDASVEDIENRLVEFRFLEIENILALRGDPPMDQGEFITHPNGHQYASSLIEQIVDMNNGNYLLRQGDIKRYHLPENATHKPGIPTSFSLGVACYPEGHSENPNKHDDLLWLKKKFDLGAEYGISQMFFDAQTFLAFEKEARQVGISHPLIPGIKPVTSYKELARLAKNNRFGISIPTDFLDEMEAHKDNREKMREIGIEYCVKQCNILIHASVPGIHFYSMNGKKNVSKVLQSL